MGSGLESGLGLAKDDRSTFDRVKAILHDDCFHPNPLFPERLSAPFHSIQAETNSTPGVFTDGVERARTEGFCVDLYDRADASTSHIARLNCKFSELIICSFQPTGSSSPFQNEPPLGLEDKITHRTLQMLERLPATSLELPGLPTRFPAAYYTRRRLQGDPHALSWEDLQVSSHLNTNVIRVALCTIIHPWISKGKLCEFINYTAALLDTATQKSTTAKTRTARYKWFLVRAFLWTSWQRTVMIYLTFLLAQQLEGGFDDEVSSHANFLRSTLPSPGVSVQDLSKRYATLGKSHHMCSWAFELLRNDPVCIGMDFRRFHKRYSSIFNPYPGRCTPNPMLSCKGDHPNSCKRFVGMIIADQSAHDLRCSGCTRLTWEEASYRSVSGARAVSVEQTSRTKLKYCVASADTLAISHVWSHGQGGRPETGMNRCLHLRYSSIAATMGCDSYWMDTPCIPTDRVLRREAISNINKVFAGSKATIVCDRDLMEIDITGDISVELRESILVTTLTCDWNIRAWTFLEAFRARQSIYLLCKDNKILSLKDTVEIVHREGGLDVGVLLLAVPHLLPRVQRQPDPGLGTPEKYPLTWAIAQRHEPLFGGFLTVENSGMLLSHRPASRPDDSVVIWSLLLNEKVFNNAIDFWRGRQDHSIHTSFLVSTAPRLTIWRFGWAPSSPWTISDLKAQSRPQSMGFNDSCSELATITAEGLKANWLFYQVAGLKLTISRLPLTRRVWPSANIRSIRKNFLLDYRWGALLRPVWANQLCYIPAPNREDASRVLLVVCGTNDFLDDNAAWEWKGIHEWDMGESLPIFTYKTGILLV